MIVATICIMYVIVWSTFLTFLSLFTDNRNSERRHRSRSRDRGDRDRKKDHHRKDRHHDRDRDRDRDNNREEKGGGSKDSMSIEETNKMRASLGLAPLK